MVASIWQVPGAVSYLFNSKYKIYCVKDSPWNAAGDGVTDDSAALQAAFQYVADNGGIMFIPSGTYLMQASGINITSASYPFKIIGAGKFSSLLRRGSESVASVINMGGFDNWGLSDFGIDGGNAEFPTSGNHGIAFFNCKHAVVERVYVYNQKNTGILAYESPPSAADNHNYIIDCLVDGVDNSNNGILIADMWASHIINCHSIRIGKDAALSPCYALQLKNGVNRCSIQGGYAQGAKIGVACGINTTTETNENNIITGVHIYDNNTGIAFGATTGGVNRGHVVSNLVIDQNDAGEAAFDTQRNTYGIRATNINIKNVANAKYGVRFREGDHDNFVHVGTFDNTNNRSCKATYFGAAVGAVPAAVNNSVIIDQLINPSNPPEETTDFIDNLSGSPTNKIKYLGVNSEQRSSIVSGAIPLEHGWVNFIRPIPEGVVDPTPASDDLTTIGAGLPNQIIVLAVRINTHTVTVKHNVGNIRLAGASDMVLNNVNDTITLRYQFFSATVSPYYYWVEVSRATYTTP
jgi:hypothetical protein